MVSHGFKVLKKSDGVIMDNKQYKVYVQLTQSYEEYYYDEESEYEHENVTTRCETELLIFDCDIKEMLQQFEMEDADYEHSRQIIMITFKENDKENIIFRDNHNKEEFIGRYNNEWQ